MAKLFAKVAIVVIFVLFLVYLILPGPSSVPALPDSLKSTEEGDTVQIPGVSAYFSDWERDKVTEFYKDYFAKSSFANLRLPVIALNHPPEYARLVIRDQILSSYLEEYVYPFRESLFVNGWEPDTYFAQNPGQREQYQIVVDNKKYFSKTTLRTFESDVAVRIPIFLLACFLFWLFYRLIIKIKNTGFHLDE